MSSVNTIPSSDQLAATRLKQWHQNGEALLTFENLRSWINAAGLALYLPRTAQLPSPAPTMVEAVLGAPNATPTLADTEQARTLLARLIAEGAVVPLNLLGNPTGIGTDTPDFIAATAILPYIFTLRGDKSWKLAPETSGASKVSPLALAAYTALAEKKAALSASALATELGKEVTETAVLRALTELWQHLRVLPIPQQDGAATLWELTSARFTKQLKAGSNAGQPTALSALISLYLGQAVVATEEEIETFLSPLAARSRIRDVVHALLGARQLETIAVEGKTVLHVAGDLPAFLSAPVETVPGDVAVPVDDIGHLVVTTEGALPQAESTGPEPRIKKFVPTPRKIGTGFVTKPGLGKPARKPFGTEPDQKVRRPFTRESNRPDRPSFTKPWAEEKADRLAAAARASSNEAEVEGMPLAASSDEASQPAETREATFQQPSFDRKPSYDRKPAFSNRPKFGDKPSFSRKPSFGGKPSFGSKPAFGAKRFDSDRGDSRPPRREFSPRPFDRSAAPDRGAASGDFAPRKTFSKPGTFGRKREGGFSPRPSFGGGGDARPPRREFSPRPSGDSRPPRREFGARPPREGGYERPSRPSSSSYGDKPSYPRRDAGASSQDATGPRYRKFDAPRGDRPARPFNSDGPARPFNSDRPARPFSSDRPARPFSSDRPARPFSSDRPSRPQSGGYAGKSSSFGDKKPYGKTGGGYAGKTAGYAGKSSGGYAGKSDGYKGNSGGFAGKKPYAKSGGFSSAPGKPAGTFDKFKGNKKPFGNRPPARKWKPDESKSAE